MANQPEWLPLEPTMTASSIPRKSIELQTIRRDNDPYLAVDAGRLLFLQQLIQGVDAFALEHGAKVRI